MSFYEFELLIHVAKALEIQVNAKGENKSYKKHLHDFTKNSRNNKKYVISVRN